MIIVIIHISEPRHSPGRVQRTCWCVYIQGPRPKDEEQRSSLAWWEHRRQRNGVLTLGHSPPNWFRQVRITSTNMMKCIRIWQSKVGAWSPKTGFQDFSLKQDGLLNTNINIPGLRIAHAIEKRPKMTKEIFNVFPQVSDYPNLLWSSSMFICFFNRCQV